MDPGAGGSATPATIADILRARAAREGSRTAFAWLAHGESEAVRLSYGELDHRARALAALVRRRCGPGERALLLYPPGLDYVTAFLGCLYAGVIAVPAPPPRRRQSLDRVRGMIRDARPAALMTTRSLGHGLRRRLDGLSQLAAADWQVTDELDAGEVRDLARSWKAPDVDAETVAFLQYTSGSTASPKGVVITHGNLLANEAAIERAFATSDETVVAGWLPPHHDMGLVGNVLHPLYVGARAVLMSPTSFLQRPRRWLEAVSRYRATVSGGPDFAYDLCVRRIPPEERRGLDLGSWQVAFNGSEPVRSATLERFAEAFAPHGFRRRSFFPCYGLAESTLFVSGGPPEAEPVLGSTAGVRWQGERSTGEPGKDRRLVGCGRVAVTAADGTRLAVADPGSDRPCPAGAEGEIRIAGPSVARGYWDRPAESAAAFDSRVAGTAGSFLATGDLGFVDDGGELFVTGRLKDLIVIRGRNHPPQDLEQTAEESHEALRPRGGAAFSAELDGAERLVVVHEIDRRREAEAGAAAAAVRRAIAAEHELEVRAVVVLRAGTLPRTTSGKVRRYACREAFLAGRLEALVKDLPGREPEGDLPGREELLALPPAARAAAAEALLRSWAARFGGGEPATFEPGAPLALDSLAAVELRNRIEADLGVDVPLRRLLEGASLTELTAAVLEGLEAPAAPAPAAAEAPGEELALSYGQRSLWFLQRLHPESTAYNVAFAARLVTAAGELGAETLRGAVERLAARHPALVFRFGERDGEPFCRAAAVPDFAVVDTRGWSASERRSAWTAEACRPFDLERGVLRVRYFTGADGGGVLLFAMHHIATDFWSLVVLADELGRLLAAADAELEPPAAGYGDFVAWQRELVGSAAGERLWAYWRERLTPLPPELALPLDRPRPPAAAERGGVCGFRLDGELAGTLRRLAAASGASLFATLLAVFEALLGRYGGGSEFLLGAPVAGRSRASFEDVVGYFVNTAPIVADLSGRPAFTELLERARAATLDAVEHADFPLPLIVERLRLERDPSRAPLFQAVFVLEKPHKLAEQGIAPLVLGGGGARVELGGVALESVALERRATPFDLVLQIVEAGDGVLAAGLEYHRDLFDATTVTRLARHFQALAAGAAAAPERRLGELPLAGAAERHQLLDEWNDTATPWPRSPVEGLFAATAARHADAVAVVAERGAGVEALTYRELGGRARRLARRLRAFGVGPEVPVALALERSPELVVAILATLEAGGFYVPLDLDYPEQRLAFMLAETLPAVVVVRGRRLNVPCAARVVDLDADHSRPAEGPARPPATAALGAGRLAYVMYTSGSTGHPKGIAVPHGAVARLVRETDYAAFGPGEVFLALAPVSFDAATFEVWGALANGGRLVLAPPGPPALAELGGTIARHRVTTLFVTTALFHLMIEENPAGLAPLGQLLTGGEVLSPARVRRAVERLRPTRFIACYGPTEATTYSSCDPLSRAGDVGPAVSIGRPIANARLHVIGRDLEPAPAGAAGELAIGGAGLARGYFARPQATAASFVPDALARTPGERLYRTGDLARYRGDGRLDFLGRRDQQVKVRGFRVELGEIEARLAEHPQVREAVVLVSGGALVAFTTGAGEPPAAAGLAAFLAGELPAYMMPSRFVRLGALPLSPTGKLDRTALLEAARERPADGPGRGAAGARTELERTVAGIWSDVLGVTEIGRDDNFFEVGGHSLAMVAVHSRLERALDREVALVDLFSHTTVSSLAAYLDRQRQAGPSAVQEVHRRAASRKAAMRRQLAARKAGKETAA